MIDIPAHIRALKSYKPGKPIHQIIEEYGLDRVSVLWNNENNLGPSPKAMQAASEALSNSHRYPDPASSALRNSIASRLGVESDQVVVGQGSEGILSNIFQAFFEPGDILLTSDGTFVAVYIWAQSHGVPMLTVPLNSEFAFDIDGLIEALTDKVKAVYVANPNNPTGTLISESDLLRLADALPKDKLLVVDEAYYEYGSNLSDNYPDTSKWRRPNVITLRTFSKAYGIAAIRVGYAIGPTNLIDVLSKVKLTFEPSNVAQAAGIACLEDDQYLEMALSVNAEGMTLIRSALDELNIPYAQSYANFVMMDLGSPQRVQQVFEALMKKGVFVRPLNAFGLPQCLRVTIGKLEENEHFIEAIRAIWSDIR